MWVRKTALLIALCLSGCSCRRAERIELTPLSLSPHCVGESAALTASVFDQHGELMPGAEVEFTSSNPGVAVVDASGIVTARSSGAAEITARSGKARMTVKVDQHLATKLVAGPQDLTLFVGGGSAVEAHARDEAGHDVSGAPIRVVAADPTKLSVRMFGFTSLATGETSVKVSCGGLSQTVPVHVVLPPFGGIVVEDGPLGLTSGMVRTLSFHELASDKKTPIFDIPLEITSSDPKVVTVDNHGVMKAIAPGSAKIRLHAGEHDATVDVTVTPSG
jgi:hypothetical protein